MTKICLISDSHGNKEKVEDLLIDSKFDYVFFMGDGLRDLRDVDSDNIKKVCGNCDFFSDEANTLFVNLADKKIMITHGHIYKAKLTKLLMVNYAKQNNAQIVCYGHTHMQNDEIIDNVQIINPGSLKSGQYAVMTIDKDLVKVDFFS